MSPTLCQACGRQMEPWQIARSCVLLRCPRCGHVVRDLERCHAAARSHPWGGNSGLDRIRIALTWRRLQTLLAGRGGLDILEIGFGRGLLLERLVDAPAGHHLTGVDRGLLQTGVLRSVRAAATLFDVAAENLRLPDGSLDLIYAIHVVEHLDDPAAVFANCRRMLREGGLLYLMTPNARSDGLRLFRDHWWNLQLRDGARKGDTMLPCPGGSERASAVRIRRGATVAGCEGRSSARGTVRVGG